MNVYLAFKQGMRGMAYRASLHCEKMVVMSGTEITFTVATPLE